jgi:sigma-B regulation protein RsbU (phosphoserine phosphatase)
MRAEARDLGTLYRAQRKVLAVDCVDDLLDLVSVTVSALYPGLLRFELYVTDRTGRVTASRVQGDTDRKCIELPDLKRLRTAGAEDDFASGPPGAARRLRMSAPLLDGATAAGLIVVEATPDSPFAQMDVEILEAVAGLFSLALQRLHSEQREYRQAFIEQDLRSAGGVQRRLMARTLPADSGVRVDARYIPALDVGGDFYDLAYLGNGRIGGAIGDVSGKGVSAALIMSGVASDLGRALRSGAGPSEVLENVNSTLTDVESETFVTASCIALDSRNHYLTVANAGHLPLMVRRASGEVLDFGAASGTPLGMVPCAYLEERFELQPLDIVFLMTDGLAEAFDCPDDRMGMRFLKRLVNSAPHDAKVVNDRILAAANTKGGTRRLDDVTLVALQLEPR